MNELTLIRLYSLADDFIKYVADKPAGKTALAAWEGKRGPKRNLSPAEVITLNVLRFYLRIHDLKTFHRLLKTLYTPWFPRLPNYENFLKATNASTGALLLFLNYLLFLNRQGTSVETFFMDSTAISVCENCYIPSHRVARSFAARGKTSKGWFYGFKLHGVCGREGTLMRVMFTPGNVYDNQVTGEITDGLEGMFVADAGYILGEEDFQALYERHRHILHGVRKNMKRVMTMEQKQLFRDRSIIETTWDVLKERFQLVYHLARGITGLFRHYLYSLFSFLLRPFLYPSQLFLNAPQHS